MLDPNTTATHLSVQDADALRKTAKWARFLAITGFVMIGLMVMYCFWFYSMTGEMMKVEEEYGGMPFNLDIIGNIGISLFLMAGVIYFVPTLLLYQFATRTLRALSGPFDPISFTSGLEAHRRLYKFMGILMIIVLSIYGLFFVFFALLAGMMAGSMH